MEPLDSETQNLNKEFLYDQKHRAKTNQTYPETLREKRIKALAEESGVTREQIYEQAKDHIMLHDNIKSIQGRFSNQERFGLGKSEKDVPSREAKARSIHAFAGSKSDDDLSEREDDDIYAHYMEQMKKAKQAEAQEKRGAMSNEERLLKHKLSEIEDMYPEMPRFEGFLNSQVRGEHPFESEKFTKAPKSSAEELAAEEKYDEELLQRELEGRLLGENLTPRQFGVLYNAKVDHASKVNFMKDQDRKGFLSARDAVRLMDEQREALRRRRVANGTWDE